jgi:putative restriction endonuclease
VNLYVYPTDPEWFKFLSDRKDVDEVNFWQPGGRGAFARLKPGELFLFRLKSPVNMIAGGGVFVHGSLYPLNAAWDAFGIKNGTEDYVRFASKIAKYKGLSSYTQLEADATIGCIVLQAPFFLPRASWIPLPPDYSSNLVQGKRYDATTGHGLRLFEQVGAALTRDSSHFVREPTAPSMWGDPVPIRRRLGQGAFRILVTDIYSRRCAISGERTLPVLEAAHIKPVTREGQHKAENGILLRSDIHTLFDLGYVTFDEKDRFRVSSRLREEWSNGRIYYDLDKKSMRLPDQPEVRPDRALLEWHRHVVFRG